MGGSWRGGRRSRRSPASCGRHRTCAGRSDHAVMSSGLATSSSDLVGHEGHGAFGEVAAFGADLPLVVGLDQDRAGQAEQRGGVGEDPDDVGAAFDFLVEPLERVGRPDLLPVRHREPGEGEQVVVGLAEHLLDLGQLLAEHRGDDLELLGDVLGVGLGEDGADRGGDHLLVALGHDREHVAHEVDPAPLPGGADEHRADRGLQPGVGVADDQLHPAEPAGLQRRAGTRSRTPRPRSRRRRSRGPHGGRRR